MFQAAPPAKMMEDGKIHAVEHIINPIAVQQDPASAAAAAAAAAAAVIPAVSTPPPFQVSSGSSQYSSGLISAPVILSHLPRTYREIHLM